MISFAGALLVMFLLTFPLQIFSKPCINLKSSTKSVRVLSAAASIEGFMQGSKGICVCTSVQSKYVC